MLGRPVDQATLRSLPAGTELTGTQRRQLAQGITTSTEFRQNLVRQLFQKLMGRQADPGGLDGFVNMLAAGGTVQQVVAAIAGSAEYLQNRGGGTTNGFIDALFQDVLGRPAGAGDLATYRFNTGVAKHHFCRVCGVAPFSEGVHPKTGAATVAVNVRCLPGVDLAGLKVVQVDGASL